MKKFIKVMKALSDPSRVKIVKMLQHKEMCVCEIREAIGIAQSTASKHLKLLEEAGLVTYRKDGLWVNYTLSDGSDNPYAASMLGNIRHWLEDDADVGNLGAQVHEIHRQQICRGQGKRSRQAELGVDSS